MEGEIKVCPYWVQMFSLMFLLVEHTHLRPFFKDYFFHSGNALDVSIIPNFFFFTYAVAIQFVPIVQGNKM